MENKEIKLMDVDKFNLICNVISATLKSLIARREYLKIDCVVKANLNNEDELTQFVALHAIEENLDEFLSKYDILISEKIDYEPKSEDYE